MTTSNTINPPTKPAISLPLGYDNFGAVIEIKADIVDKTLFIQDVFDNKTHVQLILRPRRFGKTLNLSMLHHFFSADAFGRKTEHLFDGLAIAQTDYMQYQGKYPVIFITLKGIADHSFENAYEQFCGLLSSLYQEHRYLLSSDTLDDYQKETFRAILGGKASINKVTSALKDLCYYFYLHHGQRTWVLIDEYDSPIQNAYLHHYYEPMIGFMRNVFGETLKTNAYLERSVITGILRVARESLFSGLNNLIVSSMLDDYYAQYFGFTETEVAELFDKAQLPVSIQDIKTWYNGYQIAGVTLYNPWSICYCIYAKGKLDLYWVNTSGNDLVRQLISHAKSDFQQDLQQLLEGKTIHIPLNLHVLFANLHSKKNIIWSLLFMAGYLKLISKERQEDLTFIYELAIPNTEILLLYRDMIKSWLDNSESSSTYNMFLANLLAGNFSELEDPLSNMLLNVASFHDMAREPEAFYQGFMLGLTATLPKEKYTVKSNKESGLGLYDLVIMPKNINKLAIIIELKQVDISKKNKNPEKKITLLKKSAEIAVQQIRTHQYATECQHMGFKKIAYLGIAFSGKMLKVMGVCS